MLSFEEARTKLLADAARVGRERVPLAAAAGRVLAERLLARTPLPPFDYSAMDGYAIRAADLPRGDELPIRLIVRGESRTGSPPPKLAPGAACRIFTGAELPEGADAVIMQEDTTREGEHVLLASRPAAGAHVRRAGEDLAPGSTALVEGTRLHPGHLALAASLEASELCVARSPQVSIVCTGDELRPPGAAAAGARSSIPESNGVALAAFVRQAGGTPRLCPFIGDDLEATVAALEEALAGADLVLTVGGVSVGDYDLVRPALERAGVDLDFYKVAIKPGKPLAYGRRRAAAGGARVLGLPGNPASALVTFALFAAPLIRALQGDRAPVPALLPARLRGGVRHKPGRAEFVRCVLEGDAHGLWAAPLANQASGAATSTAWANALALVPLEAGDLAEGSSVSVLRLSDV